MLYNKYNFPSYMTYMESSKFRDYLSWATKALKGMDFDAVAFRGMSGAMFAPTIANRLNKKMILVRKNHDVRNDKNWDNAPSHCSQKVCGYINSKRYLIVDDFCETGRTASEIMKEVKKFAPKAKCVGLVECTKLNIMSVDAIKKRIFEYKK